MLPGYSMRTGILRYRPDQSRSRTLVYSKHSAPNYNQMPLERPTIDKPQLTAQDIKKTYVELSREKFRTYLCNNTFLTFDTFNEDQATALATNQSPG